MLLKEGEPYKTIVEFVFKVGIIIIMFLMNWFALDLYNIRGNMASCFRLFESFWISIDSIYFLVFHFDDGNYRNVIALKAFMFWSLVLQENASL